jgi:anthranilate phosphoribosyltransferase
VSSADGLDELSASGPTHVVELKGGTIETYEVAPEQVGLEPATNAAVGAGTPDENARVLRRVLDGEPGTERSMAVLNAGAAIYVGGAAASLEEGVRTAERAVDDGSARNMLERFVARTAELGAPA